MITSKNNRVSDCKSKENKAMNAARQTTAGPLPGPLGHQISGQGPVSAALPPGVGTCLVVDDNAFDRRLVRRCLAHDRPDLMLFDCATITAARDFLSARKPDVILLDHRLPDGEGTEFAKELRANPAMANTVVCVVTNVDTRLLDPSVPALSKDDLTPQTLWQMVSDFLTARRIAQGSEAGQLVEDFGAAVQDNITPVLTKMLRTLRGARAQLGDQTPEGADADFDRLDGMLLALGDVLSERRAQGPVAPVARTTRRAPHPVDDSAKDRDQNDVDEARDFDTGGTGSGGTLSGGTRDPHNGRDKLFSSTKDSAAKTTPAGGSGNLDSVERAHARLRTAMGAPRSKR